MPFKNPEESKEYQRKYYILNAERLKIIQAEKRKPYHKMRHCLKKMFKQQIRYVDLFTL